MIFPFSKEQAAFPRKTFGVNPNADMDTETQLHLEDMLSEHLQVYGINEAGDGEKIFVHRQRRALLAGIPTLVLSIESPLCGIFCEKGFEIQNRIDQGRKKRVTVVCINGHSYFFINRS